MGRNALASAVLAAGLVLHAPTLLAEQQAGAAGAHGFSQERLDRIAGVMEREIDQRTMPGAVTLIARGGTIVHHAAHGHLDAEGETAMETGTLFRYFSMTKPIVSVAAMMLVEDGHMALRDPITTWFPEFEEMTVLVPAEEGGWEEVPAQRPITVHDLLRHTSGFGYANNTPAPIAAAYEEADVEARQSDPSPEEFIARLAEIPLVHQPGTAWH